MATAPYKGELVDLLVTGEAREKLLDEASRLPDLVLKPRQLCDLELLMNGGFSPLRGFMDQANYESVVDNLRLVDGSVWPMPIVLDVTEEQGQKWKVGDRIALRDPETNLLAVLTIESSWVPNKAHEAEKVFGSPDDKCHPSIAYLMDQAGPHYLGGAIAGLQLPVHYDFADLRKTPKQLREVIEARGIKKLVGFQTRNPMHRSHHFLTVQAAKDAGANVLVHPVVGATKPGDVGPWTRVRVYREIVKRYDDDLALLCVLPLAMRMAGPREALWHSIIRKNYGCTHFIVGRDHAGPGKNKDGKDFYGPYDAQALVNEHKAEVGIEILTYQMVVYVEDLQEYRTMDNLPEGAKTLSISGTELRRRLVTGEDIPAWFSFPNVVAILRETYPPRLKQGFTVFFTGFSGAGKSTVANAVRIALTERGGRTVTLLDGDHVRRHLSTELGFSKEHRDLNVRRIAYVASEITKARGIAICAAIAPYTAPRRYAREIISQYGGFIEVHVSTPLSICEKRDRKGLYAKARQGILKGFTGIDDPYEAPQQPELSIDTSKTTVQQSVSLVMNWLEDNGYLQKSNL